jgi:uncharacterized protein (UPF0261 family)
MSPGPSANWRPECALGLGKGDRVVAYLPNIPETVIAMLYVPLGGFSSHDSTEGNLYRLELPPIFAKQCEAALPEKVALHPVEAHINDPAFADALIAVALPFIHASARPAHDA